jgi:hypothetical protein
MACLCWHRGEEKLQLQPICNLNARRGWSATSSGCFSTEKDSVPIVQEAELASGLVWMGTENLVTTASRSSPSRVAILTNLAHPHLHD